MSRRSKILWIACIAIVVLLSVGLAVYVVQNRSGESVETLLVDQEEGGTISSNDAIAIAVKEALKSMPYYRALSVRVERAVVRLNRKCWVVQIVWNPSQYKAAATQVFVDRETGEAICLPFGY